MIARVALFDRCPPPPGPPAPGPRPVLADVLAHLAAAFPDTTCPLAAYLRFPTLWSHF